MLSQTVIRVVSELGPWLWMLSAFALMTVEIFSGRGVALSLALGAMIAGALAVFGASGIWLETSNLIQIIVFVISALTIFVALKARPKST